MAELEVVGRPASAIRSRDIVTGKARYAADYRFSGLLVGKLLYTSHPHARITGIDVTVARAMPGVACVLTAGDIPGENSYLHVTSDQPLLVSDRVRYQGDALAAVAAEDEATALAALQAIRVDYEPLPGVFDAREAMQPGSPQVWDDRSNIADHIVVQRGDVEAGMREADVVIERTYRTPLVEQAFIETEGATALVDESGTIVVYSSCQAPFADRLQIARALGLPETRVRVIQPFVGGGFGGKDEAHVQIHAALLAWATHRPVNLSRSREESIRTHVKRHPMLIEMRTGATREGRILAVQARLIADTGPYRNSGPEVVGVATTCLGGPYEIPNVYFEGFTIYTNNPIAGAFRGFGGPQANLAHELQMDELASVLGIDPLEMRLVNGVQTGSLLPSGIVVRQGKGMKASLREAAGRIGWHERAAHERAPAPHLRRGWGIAACAQPIGIGRDLPDSAGAGLDMAQDGSVLLRTGAADMGQGTHTILAQFAAEALGVDLAAVRVLGPDTRATVDAGRGAASRQAIVSGNAVLRAAAPIRESLLQTAAEMGYPRDALELRRGRLYVEGEAVNVTVGELAARAWNKNRRLHADGYYTMEYPEPPPATGLPFAAHVWAFGAQAAQVLVDVETGQVTVEKLVAAHDVGQIINPDGAFGQVAGGAAQGIGYATMEALLVTEGRTLTNDLHSYLLPTARDVPDFSVALLESGEPYGPYGATGLGEPPIVPTAAAILNAVSDAVGGRLCEIPLTLERVAEAAGSRRATTGKVT